MRFFLHLSVSFDTEMLSGLLVEEYSALLSEMSPPEWQKAENRNHFWHLAIISHFSHKIFFKSQWNSSLKLLRKA